MTGDRTRQGQRRASRAGYSKHHHHHDMTPLEQKVYAALASVPRGRVTTYGELARAAGLRNGQRAIGRIMGKNPYPGIIPCHRVVLSTGRIGGYMYGQESKKSMLAREGVSVSDGIINDMDGIMHRFDE